jgi:hypothetical protein
MTKTKEYYRVGCCDESLAFCCGIREIGEMKWNRYEWTKEDLENEDEQDWGLTKADAIKKHIARVLTESNGRPIVYWFVRRRQYNGKILPDTRYDMHELRSVIMRKKGVVKLGTFINPGTKNQIDGYMLTAHSTKGVKID